MDSSKSYLYCPIGILANKKNKHERKNKRQNNSESPINFILRSFHIVTLSNIS